MDYESLGLKVGLEIHQQLATHKLFCNCESELKDGEAFEFERRLRPTQSEMGEVDRAALAEAQKKLKFRYQAPPSVCIVEADEEPPHEANPEAVNTALEFALMVNANFVDEVAFMRKIVIDGSNTSGFQRTALIATGGDMSMGDLAESGLKSIGILTICLEEDAARKISQSESEVTYRLDRLGIPLIEVATKPEIRTPDQARDVALRIGSLLRATRKVKRGIGTVREDLNISVEGGARVEIKGVQELRMIATYVEEEILRQLWLIKAKEELERRDVKGDDFFDIKDVSGSFQDTDCRVIKRKLESGGIVIGVRLKGFAGLLGDQFVNEKEKELGIPRPRGEGRILGPELAAYVNTIGVMGIFHTDELPAFGITEEDMWNVKNALQMEESDAFLLVAEEKSKAQEAVDILIARSKEALLGVPEETRDPQPDGTSKYSRPLPGKARMYPETDVPPIPIESSRIERIKDQLAEFPEVRQKRYQQDYVMHAEHARQLISAGYDEMFEELVKKHEDKKMIKTIAKLLLNTIPELESQGVDTSFIELGQLDELISAVEDGRFAKEGLFEVLKLMLHENLPVGDAVTRLGLGALDDSEMERVIDSIVTAKMEFIKSKKMDAVGPLMGPVMEELRGKVDGKKVNQTLRKKIQEVINSNEE